MSFLRKFAAVYLILLAMGSVLVNVFWLGHALDPQVSAMLQGPSFDHLFGTDSLGRDLFARLLLSARLSMAVGLGGAFFSVLIGMLYGMAAGWGGRFVDRWLMRGADLFQAIPSFMLVAVCCLAFQARAPFEDSAWRTGFALVIGIAISHWMSVARVTRVLVLRSRTLPYVEAARALGGSEGHILRRHVIPMLLPSLAILLGLHLPSAILYESFMSFIGVGIQPPETSWGVLVQEGWRSLAVAPHLVVFPAFILFLTIWSLHLLFDPFRLSQRDSGE